MATQHGDSSSSGGGAAAGEGAPRATPAMEALALKMMTGGVDSAMEWGRQHSVGDDVLLAVSEAFRFSAMHGALSVARASDVAGMLDTAQLADLDACLERLRERALRPATEPATPAEDDALVAHAGDWLRRLGVSVDAMDGEHGELHP